MYLLFGLCFILILINLFLWKKISKKNKEVVVLKDKISKENIKIKKCPQKEIKLSNLEFGAKYELKVKENVPMEKSVNIKDEKENEKPIEKVLQEILIKDINLLISRNALVEQLEKNVSPKYSREIAMIQKALQYNIGELFLKANNENTVESKRENKAKIKEILQSNNIQERNIQKLIKIFEYALSWENIDEIDIDEKNKDINNTEEVTKNKDKNQQNNDLLIKELKRNIDELEKEKIAREEQEEQKLKDLWNKSINEYNTLSEEKDSAYKRGQARNNFIQKYQVKKFTNDDYEQDIYDEKIHYYSCNKLEKYWAILVKENIYAVFPKGNLKYGNRLHNITRMKEVFDSNYQEGAYKKIKVIKPAVFRYINTEWTLYQKGKLKLIK